MKKVLGLALTLAMVFTLVSCGNATRESENSNITQQTTTVDEGVEKEEVTTEVTLENLSSFPTTDEDEFTISSVEGGVEVTDCSADDYVIVVPESINGKKVVSIGNGAFYNNPTYAIVLPDSVTFIDENAFFDCTNMLYIDLGEGLQNIGELAFCGCASLKTVTFPDSLQKISSYIFQGCDSIEEIYIPETTTDIPRGISDYVSCPNAVVVTPAGSAAEAAAIAEETPVRNP
jgi:hypothetical protein